MSKKNELKDRLLGMPHGTAANRLRKMVLFSVLRQFGLNICFRCNRAIDTERDLSLEHKTPWQSAPDPVAMFFEIANIAYSHLSCNSGAGVRPSKLYASRSEMRKAVESRRRGRRVYDSEYRQKYYSENHK